MLRDQLIFHLQKIPIDFFNWKIPIIFSIKFRWKIYFGLYILGSFSTWLMLFSIFSQLAINFCSELTLGTKLLQVENNMDQVDYYQNVRTKLNLIPVLSK